MGDRMASESSDPGAPRIGVTWVTPGERVSDNYLEAARRAGGEPVPLPRDSDCWEAELRDVDGLMLTGGVDVDPDLYGVEKSAECQPPDPVRDRRETEALRFALERGLPVLGICRGFQFLNVYLGGTLLQDIPTERPEALTHHRPEGTERSSFHSLRVLPGTKLETIVGSPGPVGVNSRHHQGMVEGQLAPGLRINALAEDGIVEGLESADGRFLVGVQCHPERPGEAPEMEAVFRALVDAARQR